MVIAIGTDDERQLWMGRPSVIACLGKIAVVGSATMATAQVIPHLAEVANWMGRYVLTISPRHLLWAIGAILLVFYANLTWSLLKIRNRVYILTEQRFIEQRGVFSRRSESMELYRILDATVIEPLVLRLFGLGNVQLIGDDKTTPMTVLYSVERPLQLQTTILRQVERVRQKRGVKQIEVQ